MYIHNLFETEQLNEGVLDLIKFKLGFLNHLHGIDKYKTDKPVEHFEKKSQELLHKIDDPKLQNVVTKFIHKGIKHPKYQAVIIAILMAFIARTSLEFSHRMGLTPAQTTYLLEAIMPGMANLVYQLMNGGSWRQSIEAAVMSSAAGVGAASAANAAFSTVEEGDQFSRSAAFRQHASGEKDKRNFKRNELQHELGHEQNIEAQIPFDVYINGRKWKTFPTENHARNIARKLVLKGKDATVKITPLKSDIEEHIVKVKGGYELKSKHGNKNLGKYPTRAGAEKRERQVQYFKHANEGVAEGLNETTSQLGPQLYTPHPKNLDESMKPKAALWTSTASSSNNGYTSAWVGWAKSEMPQWVGHSGFLYDVSPNARILTINSDRDAMRVANKYGMNTTDIMDLFMYMPWKKIAKDYDAIHHVPSNRGADLFMHSWDVESTAWFNTKMLLNKRKVPILASKQGNLAPVKLR